MNRAAFITQYCIQAAALRNQEIRQRFREKLEDIRDTRMRSYDTKQLDKKLASALGSVPNQVIAEACDLADGMAAATGTGRFFDDDPWPVPSQKAGPFDCADPTNCDTHLALAKEQRGTTVQKTVSQDVCDHLNRMFNRDTRGSTCLSCGKAFK